MRFLKEEKLPPVALGKDIVINDIPFLNTAVFKPVVLEYKGNVPNPFFKAEGAKGGDLVGNFLTNRNPNKKGENKTELAIQAIMNQHPFLNTPENLSLRLNKFVIKLKQDYPDLEVKKGKKGELVTAWKSILNPSGAEEEYVSFKSTNLPEGSGLYIWVIDNIPYYLGIATNSFNSRINNEYGRITPGKCTVNNQAQTCRSNTKYRDFFNAKRSVALHTFSIDIQEYINNPEFMDYVDESESYNFSKHPPTKTNVMQVFESMILNRYDFEGNIQHSKKMEEINRLQELAGIPKKSQILYRIDPSLEKLGIVDDSEIESGSDEWAELVSLIYQIPFDGDIENFLLQIDKKSQEIDFPISKLEMQLDVRGIEIV